MSRLPTKFLRASEADVLSSLRRLLASKKITPADARGLWAAYRVARSEETAYYLSYEIRRTFRKENLLHAI